MTAPAAAQTPPEAKHRADYRAPDYLIDEVALVFALDEAATEVSAELTMRRNPAAGEGLPPLVLDGEELELLSLALDGQALSPDAYAVTDKTLTLQPRAGQFTLTTRTRIHPDRNTALEGLYVSNHIFCTQCEAEGFRKITYYLDRPDVMSRFQVRIEADQTIYPVLLSNGNRGATGPLPDGRHFALWDDPFRKPAYLFALVAGDLACVADRFVTRSGRTVALEIYTEHQHAGKCAHAMASLKKSMRWDEERFGLEYDLDLFMIVAISDFNMGAMENKGLNIFNTKYVLADQDTATDADYLGIESVIAHEYFHNWTGNRVTCRDWFQLTLKEGLTVFRDQEFTADVHARAVKRIDDVKRLRASQFLEDSGPLAHPIRPDSYVEINNFYTTTIYEKGAEVIRMIHSLIGEAAFQAGMRLYFERHDGQAVTCEDFVAAMADASGRDLGGLRLWYSQAGTPRLQASGRYDAAAQRYVLSVQQQVPPTPGQPDKQPMTMPLAVGLLDPAGRALPLRLAGEPAAAGTTRILELSAASQDFTFVDVPAAPVPSLLRGFSAPVILHEAVDQAQLAFRLAHDEDAFVRWESGQSLATGMLLDLVAAGQAGRPLQLAPGLAEAFARILAEPELDRALAAQLLTLPAESYIGEQLAVIDVDAIHAARQFARATLGRQLAEPLRAAYAAGRSNEPYRFAAAAMGRRSLQNLALAYLMAAADPAGEERCLAQFAEADNMTDRFAALGLIAESALPARAELLQRFYERWQDEALVIDKWFALQATAQRPDALEVVQGLLAHAAFRLTNPNRVRALIGSFAMANPTGFHRADGAGYRFVAEQILSLDRLNPQIAARLLGAFGRWRRYDPARQSLMQAELDRILATPKLSRDSYEIASKSLAGAAAR